MREEKKKEEKTNKHIIVSKKSNLVARLEFSACFSTKTVCIPLFFKHKYTKDNKKQQETTNQTGIVKFLLNNNA